MASSQFTSAIFFDNEHQHIADFTKKLPAIESIKVNDTNLPYYPSSRLDVLGSDVNVYIMSENLGDNFYVKLLEKMDNIDNYDKLSGISNKEISKLKNWVERTASQERRAAIFDWDRTITKIEGATLPKTNENITLTDYFLTNSYGVPTEGVNIVEDYLTYLCGGKARLTSIRNMFNLCKDNNIDIIILTNNGACLTTTYIFRDLINNLVSPLPEKPITFLCSKAFRGDKVLTLLSDGRFTNFSTGGKRKSRKSKKNKRNTRRNK